MIVVEVNGFIVNVFDRNVGIYQAALKDSGFNGKITYNNQSEQASNVKHRRSKSS